MFLKKESRFEVRAQFLGRSTTANDEAQSSYLLDLLSYRIAKEKVVDTIAKRIYLILYGYGVNSVL
jgi:hypothetical protein